MGNAQSASIVDDELLRLSKSRPNAKTPSALFLAQHNALRATPSEELSEIFNDLVIASNAGDPQSQNEARQRLRVHLFGLDSESEYLAAEDPTKSNPALVNGDVSRSASVISSLSSEHVSTSTMSSSTSDPRPVRPLNKREESENNEKNRPISAEQHTSNRQSTATRRKSFFTASLASRGKIRKTLSKAPPPETLRTQADREYYFNPEYPDFSPLSRLAALDLVDCLTQGPPRSATPCDLDYSHLTGLKRGTLRVTNGASSPAPDAQECRRLPDLPPMDQEDSPTSSQLSLRSADDEYHGRCLERTTSRSPPHRARSESPVKRRSILYEDDVEADEAISPSVRKLEAGSPHSQYETSKSPDKTSMLAKEYLDELPSSPFSRLNSVGSERVSDISRYSSLSQGSVCEDAPASSQAMGLDAMWMSCIKADTLLHIEEVQGRSHWIGSDVKQHSPSNPPRAYYSRSAARQSPGKADSGYSSSGSVRSVLKSHDLTFGPSDDDDEYDDDEYEHLGRRSPDSGVSFEEPASPLKVEAPLKVAPPVPPKSPPRRSSQRPCQVSSTEKPLPAEDLPPTVPPKVLDNFGSEFATAIIPDDTTESGLPMAKPATAPARKLQKHRPISLPPVTFQSHPDLGQHHIPSPSPEIVCRHAERLKTFPSLDHTYASLDATTSPTRSESFQSVLTHVSFPASIATSDGAVGSGQTQKPGYRTTSRAPPRPTVITSLGTVSSSLGSSPYDIARPAPLPTFPQQMNQSQLDRYPHQIGMSQRPRSYTTVGMDAEVAAMVARERSQDLGKAYLRTEMSRESQHFEHNEVQLRGAHPVGRSLPPTPIDQAPYHNVQRYQAYNPTPSQRSKYPPRTFETQTQRAVEYNAPYFEGVPVQQAAENHWNQEALSWRHQRASASEHLAVRWSTEEAVY
ncbi:MAG: hypothetical protein M1825_000259 [Sarcosagium campestre]|nr:MAG: hypothetical protein M1825_000259 [Sarcosagium campestre]